MQIESNYLTDELSIIVSTELRFHFLNNCRERNLMDSIEDFTTSSELDPHCFIPRYGVNKI